MLCLALAWGAPLPARLTATVHADGKTVTGTLVVPPGTTVQNPFPLPTAPDDLNQLRTFPGAVRAGAMELREDRPGEWWFETSLPKRFGALGSTPWHGTYALGGFTPQPMVDGRLADALWEVTLTLPEGRTGVVGTTVGTGTLTWTGRSERVAMALPRKAQVETHAVGEHTITLVGKGRPRRHLSKAVQTLLTDPGRDLVLVEAPLRRRLVRHSSGVAFVSDRIFRLSPPFTSYHRRSFIEGVAAAAFPSSDPMERELIGSVEAEKWATSRKGSGATGFTRLFSWVPQIDYLLSSRRIAFYSEVFEEVHSSDPVRDDLAEVLAPSLSGSAVHRQLDDAFGPATTQTVVRGLRGGLSLEQALQFAKADPNLPAIWRRAPQPQDYQLRVGEQAVVTRIAPPTAPEETLVVRVDGEDIPLRLAPGESARFARPDRIRIDPRGHIAQTSRRADSWPQRRFRFVTSAWLNAINLTRFRLSGSVAAWLRGRDDTRNVFSGTLSSSRSTLVGARLGWTHKFGPLIDGISRRQRVSFRLGPNLIDPSFLADEDGPVSLVSSVSLSQDTRVSSNFPLKGRRLSVGLGGGFFPGTASRWASASASATGIASIHPRHAFAARTAMGVARSTRPDQLVTLGGLGLMRSLPVLPPCQPGDTERCAPVAEAYAFSTGEYRVAPLRNINVPIGFGWWTELQATVGLEAVVAAMEEGPGTAVGTTVGLAGIGDVFGAQPNMLGVTAGWSLWTQNLDYGEKTLAPEVYLRWGQAF